MTEMMPEYMTLLIAAAATTVVSWLLRAPIMQKLPKLMVPLMVVPLVGALAVYLGTIEAAGELSELALVGAMAFLHQLQDQLRKAIKAYRKKDRLPRVGDPERVAPQLRMAVNL